MEEPPPSYESVMRNAGHFGVTSLESSQSGPAPSEITDADVVIIHEPLSTDAEVSFSHHHESHQQQHDISQNLIGMDLFRSVTHCLKE